MSARRFLGRRSGAEGSISMRSSATAHPKNEWRTETTFARVAELRFSQRFRMRAQVVLCEPCEVEFRVVLSEFVEDSPIRLDRARRSVPLDPPPIEEGICRPFDSHGA